MAAEKSRLQDKYHRKELNMLEQQGRVRAEEADRMNQILTSLGKELEEKRVGANPNEDCPKFMEDESTADPWLPARSKR